MKAPRSTWGLRAIICAVLAAAAFCGVSVERPQQAVGQERNFAGSLQVDYLLAPTELEARDSAFDGFTTELALKLAVDFNDAVSSNVKVCYGCHGFELNFAFVDLRVADELNFRVGRFNPAFGEFPLRHDPANHRTSDKPLPYDMGRMLRLREWNMGIMPTPYTDNGLEVNGTHWFGDTVQLDYAVWLAGGFRGGNDDVDLDWVQSHTPAFYYVDNNSRPAVGGRLALSLDLSNDATLTVGASAQHGTYDPNNDLSYTILGAEAYLRLGRFDLRGEYLVRRTQMSLGDNPAARFRYARADGVFEDYFLKDGFYLEANMPVGRIVEFVMRWDGLRRFGNVVNTSPLRSESWVLRYTAGVNFILQRSIRLKLTGEFYDFSDFDDDVAVHTAIAAVY